MATLGWIHRPATPRGALWRLHHPNSGEDLVPHPAETIMAPSECSVPRGVDLSIYRNGVRITCKYLCAIKPPKLVMSVQICINETSQLTPAKALVTKMPEDGANVTVSYIHWTPAFHG